MNPDPIYMEKRALEFLRAWPDVEPLLRPVYSRFYDTGLIWVDPNVDRGPDDPPWPGPLRLTERGQKLKDLVDGQSFNFFTHAQITPLLPNGDLTELARRIFKDDLPHPKLAKVLPRKPLPVVEAVAKWKYAQGMLGYKLGRMMRKRGVDTSDLGPNLDDEIPF